MSFINSNTYNINNKLKESNLQTNIRTNLNITQKVDSILNNNSEFCYSKYKNNSIYNSPINNKSVKIINNNNKNNLKTEKNINKDNAMSPIPKANIEFLIKVTNSAEKINTKYNYLKKLTNKNLINKKLNQDKRVSFNKNNNMINSKFKTFVLDNKYKRNSALINNTHSNNLSRLASINIIKKKEGESTIVEASKRASDTEEINKLLNKRFSAYSHLPHKKGVFKNLKIKQYWSVIKIVIKTCSFLNEIKENVKIFGTEREVNIFFKYAYFEAKKVTNNNNNKNKFALLNSNNSNLNNNCVVNNMSCSNTNILLHNNINNIVDDIIKNEVINSSNNITNYNEENNNKIKTKTKTKTKVNYNSYSSTTSNINNLPTKKARLSLRTTFSKIVEFKIKLPKIILDITSKKFKIIKNIRGYFSYFANIILPLFIAFYKPFDYRKPITVIAIIIDIWFIFELLFKFFYYQNQTKTITKSISYKTILLNYILKFQFIFQLISAVPFFIIYDFIIYNYSKSSNLIILDDYSKNNINKVYSFIIDIYQWKLFNYIIILGYCYKIIFNITNNKNLLYSTDYNFLLFVQELLKINSSIIMIIEDIIYCLIFIHIFACLFLKIGLIDRTDNNWINNFNLIESSDYSLYLTSFYFSATCLCKVGYGDIYPINNAELIIVKLWLISSNVFYTILMSKLAIYVSNLSSKKNAINQKIKVFSDFLCETKINPDHYKRMISEYHKHLNCESNTYYSNIAISNAVIKGNNLISCKYN